MERWDWPKTANIIQKADFKSCVDVKSLTFLTIRFTMSKYYTFELIKSIHSCQTNLTCFISQVSFIIWEKEKILLLKEIQMWKHKPYSAACAFSWTVTTMSVGCSGVAFGPSPVHHWGPPRRQNTSVQPSAMVLTYSGENLGRAWSQRAGLTPSLPLTSCEDMTQLLKQHFLHLAK